MAKGVIRILNNNVDIKTQAERDKVLKTVMKKLSKKNINIINTDVTDTHTIINYEVKWQWVEMNAELLTICS